MACTKCPKPTIEGRSLCKEHWAEYMREHRANSVTKREKEARVEGFRAGVEQCVVLLRKNYGERPMTGYQTARLLELQVSPDTPEYVQRQAFLATLRARWS